MPARFSLPQVHIGTLIAFLLTLAWIGVALPGSARAQDTEGGVPEFHCFLSPNELCDVFIGDTIEVHFEVDSTAVQFNGYELTLQYDPNLIDFVDIAEGPLMTNACGTRFQNVSFTDSTITYSHVILCNGVSIDGPGRLSSFQFVTLAESTGETEITIASDPDRLFVDAGLWVWPDHPTFPRQVVYLDGGLTHFYINDPLSSSVGEDGIDDEAGISAAEAAFGARLFVLPNPVSSADGRIDVAFSRPLPTSAYVELIAPDGRRALGPWTLDAGRTDLALDIGAGVGRSLPAGTYFLRATSGEASLSKRIVVIP